MKTKFKRFGNSAVAIVLAAIMVLSSSIVGSSSTVNTKASEANSAAVEETTPSEVTEEALTEETASENGSVFVDNEEVIETSNNEQKEPVVSSADDEADKQTSVKAVAKTVKALPNVSGDSTTTVYFYNTVPGWNEKPYVYYFGAGITAPTWQDENQKMTHVSGNLYSAEVPSSATIIFSGGGSGDANQTENQTINGSNNCFAPNEAQSDIRQGKNIKCSSAPYEISIDSNKTYLMYWKNSNGWQPSFAHMWGSKATAWPGYLMSKVSGYDNLYAVDITNNYTNFTNLLFHDGSGVGDKITNGYDYSAHKSINLTFSSTDVYNSSNDVVWIAQSSTVNSNDGDPNNNGDNKYRQFGKTTLETLTGNDTSEPDLGTNIRVYAKSGTVRDQGSNSSAQYNKYSELADTTIYADGTTESNDSNEYHGFSYYKKNWWGYQEQGGGNRVTLAHAAIGTKINITTTIKSDFRSKYYVKAFCINGESYNIIDESKADTTNGVYTCSYIVPADAEAVEITPIYYYIEGNNSSNYITFAVEDFAGSVKAKWGNTIACYAWYEHGNNAATADSEATQQALGGYPGQPMLHEGGSYYMQLPKSTTELGNIKGITLNNYVWDDVHGYYLRTYTDFNGLDNTADSSFTNVTHRKVANAQTYDYDDLAALNNLGDVDEIIFSFKYRTFNNDSVAFSSAAAGKGNLPEANDISAIDAATKFGTNANNWNVLVDYDDHPVDLFGNDLSSSYANDSAVFNADNSNKLFVVSDGYINYYTNSTVPADKVSDDYLGEYATKWYVYTFDGTTYTYKGALPPSAFITTSTLAGYSTITADNETAAKAEFAKYLTDEDVHTAAVNKLFDTYKTLFNNYKNCPVEITYESALNSNGRYGANSSNYGYRNDGRWYYSRKSTTTIHANTKIYIIDENGQLDYEGTKYTLDEYGTGKKSNVGTTTGAKACFANSDKGLKHAGETSLTNVVKDSEDYFNLTADSSSIVTDGDKTYQYTFEGWYLDTGGNVLNPITESTKAYRRMNSFATYVAVYSKAEVEATTKNLVVNHKLYANEKLTTADPAAHDGTGKTYVESITIEDSSNAVLGKITGNEVDALNVNLADSKYSSAATVKVTIRTVPGNDSEMYKIYKYNENGTTTKYADVTGTLPSATATGTTVTYTYTVSDLFGTGEGAKSYAQIDLFSDLKRTSTAKDIALEFKFYDRDVQNNRTATIKSTPTTLHYTLTDITDYASLKNKLGSFVGTTSDEGIEFIGDLGNVVDDYYIWSSQQQAIDPTAGLGDLTYYKDDTLNGDGTKNEGKVKYSNLDNYSSIKAYHTDYLSTPQTSGEKWITYYNGETEITEYSGTTEIIEGITVYNDNVDVTNLTKVVLWAFNAPKEYTLTVCTDQKTKINPNNENEELAYHGTLIYANQGEGDNALYFFGDEESDNIVASMYTGFYNQRVGAADTEGAAANGSDGAVDYLINYFGRTDDGAVTTDIAYTGDVVEAPQTATGESYDTGSIDENNNPITSTVYYFDGWYTKAHNGKYVKVSSDRVYGNRITSDLTLYSMYKKVNAYASDSTIGGTTATSNGTDVYVTEATANVPVKKVRLNTQLNVYYNGKHIDNDANIKQVSVVYVNLNDSEVVSEEAIATAGEKASTWINNNKTFLTQGTKARKSGKVTLYEGDTDKHVVIMDTYQNTKEASSDLQITLTSKNRVQFVLPMTSALYDDTYNNLIAFVAIQYQDGESTSQWYVSDNYVSYVHG